MLSRAPIETGRNCDSNKAIVFYGNDGFLTNTIFEASPEPGVDVTWNVYRRCSDEVVPMEVSEPASWYVRVADDSYHEVRV